MGLELSPVLCTGRCGFQTGPTNYPIALHHDFAFIAGDFNFRLHTSHQQVVEELNSGDLKALLS